MKISPKATEQQPIKKPVQTPALSLSVSVSLVQFTCTVANYDSRFLRKHPKEGRRNNVLAFIYKCDVIDKS